MKTIVIGSGDCSRRTEVALLFVFLMLSMWACKAVGEEVPKVDQGRKSAGTEETQGPSFDCSKASTKVEKAVCDNGSLSKLDVRLSEFYQKVIEIPNMANEVKKSQLEWLENERAKCGDGEGLTLHGNGEDMVSCLVSAYEKRLQELKSFKTTSSPGGDDYSVKENSSMEDSLGSEEPLKFKLMTGGQYSLCRDYVDMLNHTQYKDPPYCERKLLSDFKKFKAVEWIEITDKDKIKEVKKKHVMMDYLWPPSRQEDARKAWLSLKRRMNEGDYPVLHRARIDIDHDGQADMVYKFTTYPSAAGDGEGCERRNSYFIVYDEPGKTREAYERPSRLTGPSYGVSEIFYYEGRAFQDHWESMSAQYHLKVNELSGIPNQVCGVNIVQHGGDTK